VKNMRNAELHKGGSGNSKSIPDGIISKPEIDSSASIGDLKISSLEPSISCSNNND